MALRHGAGELRRSFDEQHAGEKWLAGKMAAQKRLVTTDPVLANPAFLRLQARQAVQEAEFRSVRQQI